MMKGETTPVSSTVLQDSLFTLQGEKRGSTNPLDD